MIVEKIEDVCTVMDDSINLDILNSGTCITNDSNYFKQRKSDLSHYRKQHSNSFWPLYRFTTLHTLISFGFSVFFKHLW